ncbi:MAG: DEAD/DEAH box helicase [Anaerolineales bacterium]|nr:DEAD/DEAH box helicase [Anaerolineales bacterium]
MTNEFSQLGLDPQLVETLVHLGYEQPTPVQISVIPLLMDGQDVVAQSKTGTGKTAAFALPMIQRLVPERDQIQGLVVAPTRELAMQVSNAIYRYGQGKGVRVAAIYGGQSYTHQTRRLAQGVDIVIGTPGRLLDLIRQKKLDISGVKTVVLDEADEMLSMGFIEDIEAILSETPSERQTSLFSATIPDRIQQTAAAYMRNPQTVRTKFKELTVNAIEQRYYLVNSEDKLAALTRLFETEKISRALIFARTRIDTGDLANELIRRGFPAEALNGDLSQDIRTQVLNRFRIGQTKVLVATDVAARGLDIEDISHVFNFDLPNDIENYVHRIGRTGRAGKTGIAISLVTPSEQFRIRKIENYTKQQIARGEIPTVQEILEKREADLLENMMVWLQRDRCKREQEIVRDLIEAGHDPVMVAAVALKLARSEEKQRPIEEVSEVRARRIKEGHGKGAARRPAARQGKGRGSYEAGMVRLKLDRGKANGIRPNDIVATIAGYANIPGHTLGKIIILQDFTLVDVPEEFAGKVLGMKSAYKIHNQPVKIRLDKKEK